MGSGTVVYSLIVGLWLADSHIHVESGSGHVGSTAVVYGPVMALWVAEQ